MYHERKIQSKNYGVYVNMNKELVTTGSGADDPGELHGQNSGILYGIGVGPGNPKLMTLEAIETIRSCDVILLPAVSKDECYAYRIVRQVCPEIEDMPLLCLPFPMIRNKQELALAHNKAYETVKAYLDRGQSVGMLTIGDPAIYSTYLYMHKRALNDGKTARIINGVPSFCAAAARLGIGLGENTQEIHIIPASYSIADALQYHVHSHFRSASATMA